MGSTIFHKFLRAQSHTTTARIIPILNKSLLSPPPLPSTSVSGESSSSLTHFLVSQTTGFQIPSLALPENGDRTSIYCHSSNDYFPSFSIGFFLNPNPSICLVKTDMDGGVSDDSPKIWADSVKKKRKRKMNKHKLRKLRKRNSRKS